MATVRPIVTVIEDHAKLRRLLRDTLQDAGYGVQEAESGSEGLKLAANRKSDLVIVDLGLPDMDGLHVVQQVRAKWASRPILVLSGRSSEAEKIAALEAGADDFVAKPFGVPELLARVRAALRRSARHVHVDPGAPFEAHGVSIDLQARKVLRNGEQVALTPNEFRVLALLVRNAGLLVGTETLVQELWGPDCPPGKRDYLRGYLAALREKLEAQPARPVLLLTEPGVGYRLMPDEGGGRAAA